MRSVMLPANINGNPKESGSKKRSQTSYDGQDHPQRQRREKYTITACDECKKRKIKCSGNLPCQRCDFHNKICNYSRGPVEGEHAVKDSSSRCTILEADVVQLKDQVQQLQSSLIELQAQVSKTSPPMAMNIASQPGGRHQFRKSATRSRRNAPPTQVQFIGPTSSEFSFNVANSTLHSLGIRSDDHNTRLESTFSSTRASPEPLATETFYSQDPLLSLTLTEVHRALDIYREELHSVYPFVNTEDMAAQASSLYLELENSQSLSEGGAEGITQSISVRNIDIMLLKMMVATALVVEGSGSSRLGLKLASSVEDTVSRSIKEIEIHLKQLQLFTLTSVYYSHCDEEVLAWRSIGIAARIALEMGLHRKESLEANVPDLKTRQWATRLFYCIYVLDRRWSFGTGMPFALNDSDIDPELPRLDGSVPYLERMVAYGRISSRVWEAIAGFGNKAVDVDKVGYLDFQLQSWQRSIPEDLQLPSNPAPFPNQSQPRSIQRLQVFLYLRANQMRILVHRHNILSTFGIMGNVAGAHLVTDLAKDTIRLLVRLRKNSTMYETQQTAFNYFLISAFSAIFLAVCHAPAEFSASCRDEFFDALSLVRDLSSHASSAKRLWKKLRGLRSVAPKLGLILSEGTQIQQNKPTTTTIDSSVGALIMPCVTDTVASFNNSYTTPLISSPKEAGQSTFDTNRTVESSRTLDTECIQSDMFQISDDLTNIFEALGDMHSQENMRFNMQDKSMYFQDGTDISLLFGDFL